MTNRKTTRRALFMSVISLMLCCAMLVGTTFAWFTDEVTSVNNIIKAGNLDVELYYQVEGQTDWTKVDANTNIFKENTLWEPGHTEVVKLKVVNEGTLALKYQLGVNVAQETGSKNILGKEFKLSDYIKYGIVEGAQTYTRDQAVAAVDATATKLNAAYNSGTTTLLPKNANNTDNEDVITVVVYMPTTVDNEANYAKGEAVPTITLGINLYATQKDAESDSFGPDYDEDAWANALKVTNAAELATAIEAVEDGGLIALADNVTIDKDTAVNSSGSWYEGIYYIGDKSFTIDLNGKTLTNDSAVNDYLMLFKNDGNKANTITIKNGTLEAASSAYCAICTSTTSTQKITINLENVNLVGNNSGGAVAKIRGGAELNVKAGTTITGKNSYVGIEAAGTGTVVNIYEGAKIYQQGTSSYVGSLVGVSGTATANVYGGSGTSAQGCFIAMTSGGTINVFGGEWIANTDGTYANDNASVLIAQSENGAKSVINVTGGTFKGGYNCYGNAVGDAQLNISGGNFNADPSAYVASGYEATKNEDGTWNVSAKVSDTQDALKAAIDNGDTTVTLAAGTYDISVASGKTLTINGTEDTVIKTGNGSGSYVGLNGASLTFNGVTIQGQTSGQYNGYAHAGTMTYNNCTIEGTITVYSNSTFTDCTFNLPAGCYVWTAWGANEVTYEGCTFNTAGKALLVYHESGTCTVNVNNCVFNATAGDKAGAIANQNCAAIEIDNSGKGVGTSTACNFTINTSGNTVDSDFSGEWRIKTIDTAGSITVNGTAYTTLAIDGKTMTIDADKNVTVNP